MQDFRDLAIQRLSIREYSAEEMRGYLEKKGATSEEAKEIVEQLVESKTIDDRRYARVIIRHHALRDKGPAYCLMKLRLKGLDISLREVQQIFREVLPDSSANEIEMARKIVDRRYPNAHRDPIQGRKAYQALIRRGFSHDIAKKSVSAKVED
jgi:SOS response regulatory protein OraA/RecX